MLVSKKPSYVRLSNAYALLPAFSADPPQQPGAEKTTIDATNVAHPFPDAALNSVHTEATMSNIAKTTNASNFKKKALRRYLARKIRRSNNAQENALIDDYITWAEDEITALAKWDTAAPKFAAIEMAHEGYQRKTATVAQKSINMAFKLGTQATRAFQKLFTKRPRVTFAAETQVCTFNTALEAITVTYDSGADGNYVSEADRKKAGLPILRKSSRRVAVANGEVSTGANVTALPIPQLPQAAAEADTFEDFTHSLMSVGKTSDAGTISIFTKDGVTVHKEDDVMITCKGAPIMIGARDMQGRYRIPLVQRDGTWRPRKPSKKAREHFQQANSVYDLPSTEQAIKWMHAVCGYPVKSTWLAAVEAGNYVGWPMLNIRNVKKYYPETTETPKGHLNQSRKNVRSTKPKPKPFEVSDNTHLKGKKERDIYTKVYNVRETLYSDQTGQFPTRSLSGNKYIMVMVDIDSSGILVEPMKSRKDAEMIRAYQAMMLRLKRANIEPKKHVMDNEVSEAMKEIIRSQYHLELVPPGCHRRNAAEVAIRNFKAHFLSILAGVADDFPMQLWDRLLPQAEITVNLLRQSNATPKVSAYAHMTGPFDYNKMPLAPMGCNVQVHEKTDKRGTWAFHSVDGWYLATSPEHYRTHKCHIKNTRDDRFSDTVQFQHKRITNPTITPHDKIMRAIADCAKVIKGVKHADVDQDMRDMQRLAGELKNTQQDGHDTTTEQAAPRVRPVPRVQTTPGVDTQYQYMPPNRPATRSTTTKERQAQVPRVQPTTAQLPVVPRTRTKRKRRLASTPINVPTTAPAFNTRARTKAAAETSAPPAHSTRAAKARKSLIPKPTRGRLTRRFQRLENEVQKALAVMDKKSGKMLNYRQLMRHPDYKGPWSLSSANEFGRLANGVGGRIKGTNTIRFIRKDEVPVGRRKDVTYGQFVCTVRPEKKEQNRTRFTVGGDRINYPGEVATPTAEMLVAKTLFNSVISTSGARFMTMDISNFYLMTPLKRPEYMKIKLTDIPQEIIDEYKLKDKVTTNGFVHIVATKGMYGLPQSGLLANKLLENTSTKRATDRASWYQACGSTTRGQYSSH